MSAGACPVCRKPADPAYRPFCSRRCANVDLQRWLAGIHRIDGDAPDEEDPLRGPPDEGGEEG